jgi:hypothetical protein
MASLNDRIKLYLTVNNIPFTPDDYRTGQNGGSEFITFWNTSNLGNQPTLIQLAAFNAAADTAITNLQLRQQAFQQLQLSDTTVLRAIENNFPSSTLFDTWKAYRQQLRDIAAGRSPGPLPAVPSYPDT